MKTIPQPVDTETCQPARHAVMKVNAPLTKSDDQHRRTTKKPHWMITKEQLQTIDINMLKNYSQFFIELS